MKIKSLIIGIAAIIAVVVATEVIYHVCTDIKTKYEVKQSVQTPDEILNEQEANLTPKQKEIAKYKSQLLFLVSDYSKISTVDQTTLNTLKGLLNAKTSGIVKVDAKAVQTAKNQIDENWKKNNYFSTKAGQDTAKEFSSYINTLNAYLDNGAKVGGLNAGNLPRFAASNMDEMNNAINEVKVQLTGLGASLDLSSPTYFTVQDSTGYNQQT